MKETSRFYSSLILLIVLNGVIKPFWIFGIDRQVQNEVGVTAYGSYFAIFNLSPTVSSHIQVVLYRRMPPLIGTRLSIEENSR